ncbi:unnamed protein product [marine sediment metagenome]|uniref:Uncharacterized protein n=1 Tax=marine sediment metagenome TaxID=412755 RepID=X1QNW8_9ZZZZ
MKLKIRMDKQNSRHVHCSIFSDENDCGIYALLGKLCMTRREYKVYTRILERAELSFLNFKFSFDNLEALEKVATEFKRREKEK